MAQNKAGTLYWEPEDVLAKTLRFLGHDNFQIHDSGMKIVIELEIGEMTFFMYPPNAPAQLLQGHVLAWLMSFEEDELTPSPT